MCEGKNRLVFCRRYPFCHRKNLISSIIIVLSELGPDVKTFFSCCFFVPYKCDDFPKCFMGFPEFKQKIFASFKQITINGICVYMQYILDLLKLPFLHTSEVNSKCQRTSKHSCCSRKLLLNPLNFLHAAIDWNASQNIRGAFNPSSVTFPNQINKLEVLKHCFKGHDQCFIILCMSLLIQNHHN